jgi:DNA polymerase III alpha subunit
MKIDEFGIVQFDDNEAFEFLYKGIDIEKIALMNKEYFDKWAEFWNKPDEKSFEDLQKITIEERTKQWLFDYREFDIRKELLSRCKTQEEINRTNLEMDMFEARDLMPVLRLMFYIVDNFRKNKIVWGVGRGSSCSSFVLYLIGIHRIHSIRYGLDIKDFLKA